MLDIDSVTLQNAGILLYGPSNMSSGAELLLVPLFTSVILAICAFFAAFFSRKIAGVFVGLATATMALFFLLILMISRWRVSWLIFVIVGGVGPISPFAILSVATLSLLALLAPLRHRYARADGTETFGRPRWSILLVACAVLIVAVAYVIAELNDRRRGEAATVALLNGDPDVRLSRFQINSGQRRIDCTNPEALRYFEDRMRRHDPNRQTLGSTFLLSLSYEGGGTHQTATFWSDRGDFNLFIGAAGDGGKPHGILLPQPRPRTVDEIIHLLLMPTDEAAGKVLILNAAGSRVEYDRSIIAK